MKRIYCNDVTEKNIDQTIQVNGWVATRRDHGGIIFLDLRDHTGLVQLVFNPDNKSIFTLAESIRSEDVIEILGMVKNRMEGTVNAELDTGKIEIIVEKLNILNKSETPPFKINDVGVNEDQRLEYRYLDIRSQQMQKNLRFRSNLIANIRGFFYSKDFIDVETPILTKTTPEGARDYLVPSRVNTNHFFALPQSPQLFKQTLMIGGLDKYFQIAKCFRDEDLRSDRQPEFTQLDVEMSFVDESDVIALAEKLFRHLFENLTVFKDQNIKFEKISYSDSMSIFGCDRPDYRNPLRLKEIKDIVKNVEFKVFSEPANKQDSRVVALKIPNGCKLSRKNIDDYTDLVKHYGAKGLAYIKCENCDSYDDGLISPIKKFLTKDTISSILESTSAQNGDLIFFSADSSDIVNDSMSALMRKIAIDLDLLSKEWSFVWVVDFPLFEIDSSTNKLNSMHHPFTSPSNNDDLDVNNAANISSKAYDLVLNGNEIGGGSIRIHSKDIQLKVFDMLGINEQEIDSKFGFFLKALSFGCPPHGGIAFGIDRLVMVLLGLDSIRDTIAFPKTQSTACLLTKAPSLADDDQLKELSIKTIKSK